MGDEVMKRVSPIIQCSMPQIRFPVSAKTNLNKKWLIKRKKYLFRHFPKR